MNIDLTSQSQTPERSSTETESEPDSNETASRSSDLDMRATGVRSANGRRFLQIKTLDRQFSYPRVNNPTYFVSTSFLPILPNTFRNLPLII